MIILSMAGFPIREELLDYFDYDINTATASAFVQARAKVLPAFIAAFTKHQKISDKEIDEVQKMIDRYRKGEL